MGGSIKHPVLAMFFFLGFCRCFIHVFWISTPITFGGWSHFTIFDQHAVPTRFQISWLDDGSGWWMLLFYPVDFKFLMMSSLEAFLNAFNHWTTSTPKNPNINTYRLQLQNPGCDEKNHILVTGPIFPPKNNDPHKGSLSFIGNLILTHRKRHKKK